MVDVENTEEYDQIKKEAQEKMEEQRKDIILSGILLLSRNKYNKRMRGKLSEKTKKQILADIETNVLRKMKWLDAYE